MIKNNIKWDSNLIGYYQQEATRDHLARVGRSFRGRQFDRLAGRSMSDGSTDPMANRFLVLACTRFRFALRNVRFVCPPISENIQKKFNIAIASFHKSTSRFISIVRLFSRALVLLTNRMNLILDSSIERRQIAISYDRVS